MRCLQSKESRKDGFLGMVDGCISRFDFERGAKGLDDAILAGVVNECDDSDDIALYDIVNRHAAASYPPEIASEVLRALDRALDLDDEDIAEFRKASEDDSGGLESERAPADGDRGIEGLIDGCLEAVQGDVSDRNRLAFELFEALLIRYRTKDEILSEAERAESVLSRFDDQVAGAFKDAVGKVMALKEEDIEYIIGIIERRQP